MEVNCSQIRVTNMKWNRKLMIPKPIKQKDFEVRWRDIEIECTLVAKNVQREMNVKYGQRGF